MNNNRTLVIIWYLRKYKLKLILKKIISKLSNVKNHLFEFKETHLKLQC